jgi:2-polyprenyl-6-methoxyphenol hydroxylase-like FAD-dependent oxidoreductase
MWAAQHNGSAFGADCLQLVLFKADTGAAFKMHDVVIVGAGPVGLCMAIDLGRRGVRCLLLERNKSPAHWPKMDRTNARSMELFRQIGLAQQVRDLGFPADIPMDIFLMKRMSDPPVAVIPFPSVDEWRARIAACHDGSLPLEPYQLVAQNKLEPMLKQVAERTPNVTVRYSALVTGLEQDADGVNVTVEDGSGDPDIVRARFVVGCDGGASTVRKQLEIKLNGLGNIHELRQVVFYSFNLFKKIRYGKGRHYSFLDKNGSLIVVQGDRKEFTLHTDLPEDTDFEPVIANLLGFPCDIKILHVTSWRHHLLLADHYRDRWVFLAGDAAHLVIPTGGLGMNTGLGDAFNLAWKLSARIKGWGGEPLLDSYEAERRPVGAFNVASAGWAAEAVPVWRALFQPEAVLDTPRAADLRHEIGKSFIENHGRMHSMRGAEYGYSYAGSPIVSEEPGNEPVWDRQIYMAHTRPGIRAPHMWLRSGIPLQDAIGEHFTLLDFGAGADVSHLMAEFRARGAELTVLKLNEPHMRKLYDRNFYLLRPDMHIAWRGNELPRDTGALVDLVTGAKNAL